MMSRHGPGFGLDDEVGLSQLLRGLPFVGVWPLPWTRHVFEITEGCAAVDPSNDGIDLRLAERHVILEFLDSHGGVNVPWRHLTGNHTLADRLRPGACLFVSRQRHRRHRPGVMALLALLLQNRCHVFGKGNGVGRHSDRRKNHADTSKQNDDRDLPAMKITVHAFSLRLKTRQLWIQKYSSSQRRGMTSPKKHFTVPKMRGKEKGITSGCGRRRRRDARRRL